MFRECSRGIPGQLGLSSTRYRLFLKMSSAHTSREFTVRAEYRFYFVGDDGVARFSNVNTGDFKVFR